MTEGPYVQAETGTFPFNNPVDCSPYDTVQGIMQQMYLYGGVTDNGELYVGALTKDSTRPAEKLDTRYNVFDTNLIREDSRFINYEVRVAGTLKTVEDTRPSEVCATLVALNRKAHSIKVRRNYLFLLAA